jgi:hypothetical protein
VFGNQLGFERAVAVTRDGDGQGAEVALERLGAAAVAGVAVIVGNRFMLTVAQVNSQFGLQSPLYNGFGELLENAVLTDQVFRFLVIGQQTVDQVGFYYFAFGHVFPWRRQSPAKCPITQNYLHPKAGFVRLFLFRICTPQIEKPVLLHPSSHHSSMRTPFRSAQ